MSDVKWEIDTLTAKVGRLHLTVSAPVKQQNWRWFWQVWGRETDIAGEKASGNAATMEEAQAEAIKHLDPKAQRAWRKSRGL